jgi:sulfite reductase alpha subunit-like flavoprotein
LFNFPFYQINIFFGTETGTSRRYAEGILGRVKGRYNASLFDIAACNMEDLKGYGSDTMALFVSSTFGNGDPPTSAKVFAQNLKALKRGSLKKLR